jgi:hypothetical protein
MNNDASYTGWRKSSYSNSSANCVEVAAARRTVGVRDSKAGGSGPVLTFGAAAWARFLSQLKAGQPGS